jgi:AcrR family transcriptional regulator
MAPMAEQGSSQAPSQESPQDPSVTDLRATDGRVPGRRGQATRRRLIDCTADLLGTTSWRDIKVIDIASAAGTSPATFYQYFANVEQVILVLAEELGEEVGSLAALVHGQWRGDKGWDTAVEFVQAFMDYWERHRSVFRVVDLATEEGDLRFRGMRTRALNGVTVAIADVIETSRQEGRSPAADAMAMAGSIVAMLGQVASHRYGFEFWGIRTAGLIESQASLLYWSVTGRKPPRH